MIDPDEISGWAFGPSIQGRERIEAFLRWCDTQGVPDVRQVDDVRLAQLERQFSELPR